MFPVMFAIGRTSGWIAQWKEMVDDPEQKIARPRQIYTGERDLDYVPIEQREASLTARRRAVARQPGALVAVARPGRSSSAQSAANGRGSPGGRPRAR